MKKEIGVIVLLFVLMTFVVVAQNLQNGTIGQNDAAQVQGAIKTYSPLNNSGKIDVGKFDPLKTKAEQRLDNINLWLSENASWLKLFLGMVPSVTWIFAIDIYFILFFLLILVINNGGKLRMAGAGLFVILLAIKLPASISKAVYHLWDIFWNVILPYGIVLAIIVAVVVVILFIALLIYAPEVLVFIKKIIEKRKEKEKKKETEINRKALDEIVKGAIQTN